MEGVLFLLWFFWQSPHPWEPPRNAVDQTVAFTLYFFFDFLEELAVP